MADASSVAAVKSEVYDGVAVVTVEGDLADEPARDLLTAVAEVFDARRLRDVVIDLTACGGVASDGLEALLSGKARAEEVRGRLKLAACPEHVLKVLEITRLRPRFECCDAVEQALKLIRS